MSIQQTKKQSDLEKRLRLLRQQVYGRDTDSPKVKVGSNLSIHQPTDSPIKSDLIYLRQDLFKIGILASAALGIQTILYYLLQNNILKLNLF